MSGTLPTLQRLALTYAPRPSREATLALFALDARFAHVLRAAREPMLAQLRLAWWREQLSIPAARWPEGEPLLGVLRCWDAERDALVTLANGWEALIGAAPLPEAAMEQLAQARGEAFAALARLLGVPQDGDIARRLGTAWALADIASRLGHGEERETAMRLARKEDWRRKPLPRALRPLTLLHGLAARAMRQGTTLDQLSRPTLITALRLGLLGR